MQNTEPNKEGQDARPRKLRDPCLQLGYGGAEGAQRHGVRADLKAQVLPVFTGIEQQRRKRKDTIPSWQEDKGRVEMQGNTE